MGRIVCCVCGKVKGYDPRIDGDSHGYCEKHFEEVMRQVDQIVAAQEAKDKEKKQ